jgi:hypothetical protein
VVLVVLWYNRHRLANLPDWIDELTFPGGAKVKFAKALEKAEEASGKLRASEGRDVAHVKSQVTPPKPIVDLARDHPNAAIVAIFEEIEKILHQMGRFLPLPTKGRDPLSIMYDLVRVEQPPERGAAALTLKAAAERLLKGVTIPVAKDQNMKRRQTC